MTLDSDDIAALKRAMRQRARAARSACLAGCGASLAAHVLESGLIKPGQVVAGFWPMAEEIDIRPLLHRLHEEGHRVVLPETPARGMALQFRVWHPEAAMIAEPFGTFRPDGALLRPDVLLVPLLAFDRTGGRLGYGGGFYDRTLAEQPTGRRLAIGCAFAAQEVPEVPVHPHDAVLDAVATENGIIVCRL